MDIRVRPSSLRGEVTAPPSKSELHRMLICAALADRETVIRAASGGSFELSDDILATISCLKALGACVTVDIGSLTVVPVDKSNVPEHPVLDCRNSASTLRFLLPVAAALGCDALFTGSGSLTARPVTDLIECLSLHGVIFSSEQLPFSVSGRMTGGEFRISGNISSQYLTGLLLSLPIIENGSSVVLTTELHSSRYISLTCSTMSLFGVNVTENGGVYTIASRGLYVSPGKLTAGGDWSGASFFMLAGLICGGSSVSVSGLDLFSDQADKAVIALFNSMHGTCAIGEDISTRYSHLYGSDMDMNETPDLFPVLAVAASVAEGISRFTGIERLRSKESDRISSVVSLISSLGGSVSAEGGDVVIRGVPALRGGIADTMSDHRIAMAAVIAAAASKDGAVIRGAECISKSWPDFLDCFSALGGIYDVI
ncbi:MAG: 3-phosphoshikimate 1-carboxyvinyltransferase [Oscillospiraceae bacterium]|nr:3-phosphoshikimate 1-carboxyvinyltransferase [Oscillospiraceae bacterium]